MASTTGRPVHGGKVTGWLSRVFALNPTGINWPRAVMILDVLLVPLVLFWAIGHEEYLLSAVFGVVFAALADPGGGYGYRASHIAVFALAGAGVTALSFGLGGAAWGWLVLAAFAVTLLAGLAVMFGVHRFIAAYLLNVWFIVALALAVSLHQQALITSYTWAQVLAWAFEGDLPESFQCKSNLFEMEWPPRSGKMKQFPEVDQACFFTEKIAQRKLKSTQVPFLDRLRTALFEL